MTLLLTAQIMPRHAFCLVRQRIGCGDYQQATGEVTFAAGSSTALFTVNIMNDLCYEHFSEYVQLTLSIPGSGVLQGESYFAKLRIDDDDFDDGTCAEFL